MNNVYIFDLDGTLADFTHREKYINGELGEKDWDSFFKACVDDTPIWETISVLNALQHNNWETHIWSGRSESVRSETEDWLADHLVNYRVLKMRPIGNFIPDTTLKRQWLYELGKEKVKAVFEDRGRVVDMWREEGLPCYQVAPLRVLMAKHNKLLESSNG